MKGTRGNLTRYSLVVLFAGLVALTADRGIAQTGQQDMEFLSHSFGVSQGRTVRINVTLLRLANPQPPVGPLSARFQLLDTEGDVIAQSDVSRVAQGHTRFWDVPREFLPRSGEPGERLQVRARIVVTPLLDRRSFLPTMEVFDSDTGATHVDYGSGSFILANIS